MPRTKTAKTKNTKKETAKITVVNDKDVKREEKNAKKETPKDEVKSTVEKKEKAKNNSTKTFYSGIGRRKTATAQVYLYPALGEEVELNGTKTKRGQIIVNGVTSESYFRTPHSQVALLEPFRTTNSISRFVTSVKVEGSGKNSQLGAVILGVSRALIKVDPAKFHSILRKRGLLTRDSRERERRKAGLMGARTKKQSPKR